MFVIEVPYIDLDKIYDSGQVFRWIKLRDQKYIVCNGSKAVKMEQVKSRLMIACSEEEFFNEWYWYLNIDGAYDEVFYRAAHMDSKFMKICAVRGNGVRIVRQDLFEIIITFALATATNIPRIKFMVETMSRLCGVEHNQGFKEAGRIRWYEFPTAQMILDNQDKLEQCKLGFRQDTIIQLAQDVVDGWLDLEELKQMEYEEAREYLMQFDGIGPKVADCICLYGLHHMQAFPVDTHIDQITNREFGLSAEEFVEWYQDEIFGIEGMIQQFMFYNEINPPKEEVNLDGISGLNKKRGRRKSNKAAKQ